MIPKV